MSRTENRKFTVQLVKSSEVLNTRIIAEVIADKIRKGDTVC